MSPRCLSLFRKTSARQVSWATTITLHPDHPMIIRSLYFWIWTNYYWDWGQKPQQNIRGKTQVAGLASLLGSLRYNSGVGWIFHGNKRHKMIQKYTKGPGNSCTSWGRLHLDQDILDPVEQDKADLSHHSPASDQEAVPDSPHNGLWKITCVECQEPLNRIVFWADSMPHLQQENIGWWCIPNASSKSVLENCLKL